MAESTKQRGKGRGWLVALVALAVVAGVAAVFRNRQFAVNERRYASE